MKIEPKAGEYIDNYVRRLASVANDIGDVVEGEFNGTPMTARPGDGVEEICGRWYQDRVAHQREKFFADVREFNDVMVGKKIKTIQGSFRPTDVNEFNIVLDDGTQLVAVNLRRR